jgi:hypothetical protein
MSHANMPQLVLSLYPSSRGYAFMFFEGPHDPFDWGVKEIRKSRKNEATLKEIHALVGSCRPDRILIEDYAEPGSRRALRIKRLYQMIVDLAKKEGIEVSRVSHDAILACFAPEGAKTKREIALAVAQQIPALEHRMPRPRQIWMSEDPRQSLFDAAALGMAFYAGTNRRK